MTSLFELREGETFQALQEDNVSSLTPFYTYFATSHQIVCVDQRFPKRPLISTSHQMGREMPCGLKTMDTTAGGSGYSKKSPPSCLAFRVAFIYVLHAK